MNRLLLLATVAAAALVVAIPASQAASIGASVTSPDGFTFVAGHGERNALNVDVFSPGLSSPTRERNSPLVRAASPWGQTRLNANLRPNIDAYLGNKDDTARVVWNGVVQIWAGSGDDTVVGSSFGQYAVAYGEAGDDNLGVVGRADSSLTAVPATTSSTSSPSVERARESAGTAETSSSSATTCRRASGRPRSTAATATTRSLRSQLIVA